MTSPNRTIDRFPYERRNAEALIARACDVVRVRRDFDGFVAQLQESGREPISSYYADRVIGGVAIDNFEWFVEDLIGATFPELLPINWEVSR